MPFCKKLDCNAKSEPPYLVTTLGNKFVTSEIKQKKLRNKKEEDKGN